MTYWIHDNQWEVNGKDTVMTLGAAAKVMLTVTDSTRKGYDMEYGLIRIRMNTAYPQMSIRIFQERT